VKKKKISKEVNQTILEVVFDFEKFCHTFLKIKDKQGRIVPLIFNNPQRILWKVIKDLWEAGKPIRVIILKARQEGISTLVEAFIFWLTYTNQFIKCCVIGHEGKASSNLFEMYKRFYNYLPEEMRIDLRKSNAKILEFLRMQSSMQVLTAEGREGVARSDTLQVIHATEVAFYPDAESVMTAMLQSLSDMGHYFEESTANGIGGRFFDDWQSANETGEKWNGMTPVFLAWFDLPDYQLPFLTEKAREKMVASLTDTEKELLKTYNLSLEQLNWRRETIRFKCFNKEEIFRQEYPSNDVEAFLVSGRPVFDMDICMAKYNEYKNFQPVKFRLDDVFDSRGKVIAVERTDDINGYYTCLEEFDVLDSENYRFAIGCLPDGEKILTDKGLKEIQQVTFDDTLVDEFGKPTKIKNIQRYTHTDTIYDIQPAYTCISSKFTGEHPILTLKDNVIHSYNGKKGRYRFYNLETEFKKAKDVTSKDILRFPIRYTEVIEPDEYDRDLDFWYFMGLYLADGYLHKNSKYVVLCLNETTKLGYVNRIKDYCKRNGWSVYTRLRGGCLEVRVSSAYLYNFIESEFKKYALYKDVPEWIKYLPRDIKVNFFNGYWDGDGCTIWDKNRPRINCVSISLKMLSDFQDILLSLGYLASVKVLRQAGETSIRGRVITQKKTYELNLCTRDSADLLKEIGYEVETNFKRKKHRAYGWIENGFIYLKINKIIQREFNGCVNNFETESHTYCTPFITTHNCDVAEGLEQGDYTAMDVLDRKSMKYVIKFHGHIDPDLLAEEQRKLQIYLKRKCYFCTERNNHGLTTISVAYRLKVKQYYQTNYAKGYEVDTNAIGFKTTVMSKPVIINDLNKAIREDAFIDEDKFFWKECQTFVRNSQGQMQAQGKDKDPNSKCYDDRVISKALSIVCHKWMPNYADSKHNVRPLTSTKTITDF